MFPGLQILSLIWDVFRYTECLNHLLHTCMYAYKPGYGLESVENRNFCHLKSNKVDVDVVLINPCPNYLTFTVIKLKFQFHLKYIFILVILI